MAFTYNDSDLTAAGVTREPGGRSANCTFDAEI